MTNSRQVKLADCVDLLSGFAFKSAQFTDQSNDVALVKGENVSQGRVLWDISKRWALADWEKFEKFQLAVGDVVIAMDRPWVPAGLKWCFIRDHDPKALLVQRCCRLRAKPDLMDQTFLRCVIGGPSFEGYIKPITTGVNIPHISGRQILDYDFPLPPLPTQRKIAGILSAYDDLIENNLRRIKILEEMAQSLYREWFVHFRFPGHESATFKDSELGRIPEGWEVKAASHISQITIGKTPPRKESQWFTNSTEGIPWISIRDMNQGRFVLNTSEGLTGEAVSKFNVKRVPEGTVLLSFKLTVGKVCVTVGEMLTNEAIAHFHLANGSAITPAYLLAYLSNFEFETLGSTSSIGRATNSQVIKKMPILAPPPGILATFNQLAEPSYSSVRSLMQRNQILCRTRDLLLPKLLSGS